MEENRSYPGRSPKSDKFHKTSTAADNFVVLPHEFTTFLNLKNIALHEVKLRTMLTAVETS